MDGSRVEMWRKKCREKKGVPNKGSIERISSVEKHLFVILIKFLKKQRFEKKNTLNLMRII